jgi:hypothetical protein
MAAPAGFNGAFVPAANANLDFAWIEPLSADSYGTWRPNKTNYIKFLVGAEVSPFYGTLRAGLAFAPLPPPFAILEFRFVYSNENLFWSDVEMPVKSNEQPHTGEVWNAEHIFNRVYDNSSFAQIQSYDMQLSGKYVSHYFWFAFMFHIAFIDVTSNYDKKSFDYMRGIPLYGRDHAIADKISAGYNFNENFSWNFEFLTMISSKIRSYNKESIFYSLISSGPLWRFNGGKSCFSLSPAFFTRSNKDIFSNSFSDPIKERILLSAQYKHFWDFRFGKE